MTKDNVLITGSTDGIGKETALELARNNFKVIIHGRSKQKCIETVKEIKNLSANAEVDYFTADFSLLGNVKLLADFIKQNHKDLNTLVNNAGVYMTEKNLSNDGFEMTFAVNYLAHFYLTNLLLNVLIHNEPSRIINVSSAAHFGGAVDFENLQSEKHFEGYQAYSNSKLYNIIFTYTLAEKLKNSGITVNALHPGVISTKLLRAGFRMSGAGVKEGASTSVYLATSPEVEKISGKYFDKRRAVASSKLSYDKDTADKLWKLSVDLIGLTE